MQNRKFWGLTAVLAVLAVFCAVQVYASVHYVKPQPLKNAVKMNVSDVKAKGAIPLPLITWGGDIATVFANGSDEATASGSLFGKAGLTFKPELQDYFIKQIEPYLSGQTPYLRGTLDMISLAAELAHKDPRTAPVIVYLMTRSSGGDCLVVKDNIKSPADLKGKTVALQLYGPHMYYFAKILADAGLKMSDVKIRWTKDLTGGKETPLGALFEKDIDAAFMISPDAMIATAGGNVGTGGESVKGAWIMLSTKTADSVIYDVYAVRADYLKAHRNEVGKFVHALLIAEERLSELVKDKGGRQAEYQKMIKDAAKALMGSDGSQAIADTEGMYGDCTFAGWKENVKFFTDSNYPRNFERVQAEVQSGLIDMGLMQNRVIMSHAKWDYEKMKAGLKSADLAEMPRFDKDKVAQVVTRKEQMGTLDQKALFSFEVFFQPNQTTFPADLYGREFKKAIDLSATYGGAIITVEGHADPLGYLKKKKQGASEAELKGIKQALKNYSMGRALAVQNSLIAFAKDKGIMLDESQFTCIGHGMMKSRRMQGDEPLWPKNEEEWRSNMRVVFKIIQVEAEAVKFEAMR